MGKRIVITAPPREKHTVDLVGKEYVVVTPKGAMAMKLSKSFQGSGEVDADGKPVFDSDGMTEGLSKFINACFGKKQGADVEARLEDPEDDLDYPQITELVSLLFE